MHHRSDALDELDTSILGLAAPLALEVRATAMCGLVPSERDIAELVRRATQTPSQGAPGIPARVIAESDALIPYVRSALTGVAIQRGARASEVALMPTLVEAAEAIDRILTDPSVALSDDEANRLEAVMDNLDEETEEFIQQFEDEFDDEQKSVDAGTEAQAVLAYKAQHYRTWPDVAVPALDGKTPRAAAKSARLRPRLVRLLDDMAADEARAPAGHRFDFAELRRELGV